MNLAEALKKYKPDRCTAGFKKDGVNAKKLEALRYYFKDGREVFYHRVDDDAYDRSKIHCTVTEGRIWDSSFILAYNWEDVKYAGN